MTTAPDFGPSQGRTVILEGPPHIELTQKAMAFAKDVLRDIEHALGEPAYIILAKVEIWELSSEQEQWRPTENLGWNVSMGGNPLSAISETQRKQLNVIDGIPFVVLADTLLDKEFMSGTIIDFDEMTNRLIQLKKIE